jgi:hypothetical protein
MPKSARYGHRGKTGLGFGSFRVSEGPKSHVISLEAPIPILAYVLAEVVKVTSVPRDTEIAHKYFPWLTEIEWITEAY